MQWGVQLSSKDTHWETQGTIRMFQVFGFGRFLVLMKVWQGCGMPRYEGGMGAFGRGMGRSRVLRAPPGLKLMNGHGGSLFV